MSSIPKTCTIKQYSEKTDQITTLMITQTDIKQNSTTSAYEKSTSLVPHPDFLTSALHN